MPDDIDSAETADEQIDSSGENQNADVEDNSHSENKNQSNFKKLAKRLKQERRENERLKAELAKRSTGEDDGEDFDIEDDDDSEEAFSDMKSELFFIKNKEAEQYREDMADMLADNPKYKSYSLSDLLILAKARFPKSVSKKTIDISSASSKSLEGADVSNIDASKLTEEQITNLSPEMYKKLFPKKK